MADDIIIRSQTKVNGQLGVLYLTTTRIHWCAHGSKEPTVILPFNEIKNQFVSTAASQKALLKIITDETPGAPNLVIEFTHPTTSRADLNMFRESIAQVLPKKAAPDAPAKPAAKPAPPKPPNGSHPAKPMPGLFGKMTQEEVMQRAGILASNKDLQTLYANLVKGGVVTEEEFWEARKSMLENDSKKLDKQPVGMSSRMVDVNPSSETCNAVRYKLTPQIIHQIFIQTPVVEKAYRDNVPTKMSEQDFWVKYFQSQYFHRDRLKGAVPGEGDLLFDPYKAEVEKDKAPVLFKRKLSSISPLDDLSADSDNALPEGYGIAQDESLKPIKLAKSLPLLRRMNRHAEVVVGAIDSRNIAALEQSKGLAELHKDHAKNQAKIQEAIELPDLEADKPPDTIPLKIQDVRRYFDAHASNSTTTSTSTSPDQQQKFSPQLLADTFNAELNNWQPELNKAVIQPKLAQAIIQELQNLTHIKTTTSGVDIMKDLEVTNEFQQQLTDYFDLSNELLRHFWSTIPHTFPAPPLSQKQTEKLQRVTEKISKIYDELEVKIKQLQDENKSKWGSLFRPITQSLSKAVEKYNTFTGG
eukprot:Phypoly_transcript_05401.p1 GENE.Phypoly_transcript_05401~~Phypoly_transcript_05401.p1  ORF type:complete len:584 (+),score=115.30 Phypoly_transcript_05401:70-1821(+)